MKICNECNIEKPFTDFHIACKGSKGQPIYKAKCKKCINRIQIKNYHAMPLEKQRERRKRNSNPQYQQEWRLLNRYGLSVDQFSDMILEQNNLCKICKLEMDPPQVDHCHATGKVRGLLCKQCNTSLGLLKENPDTLRSMIGYLNDHFSQNLLEELPINREPTNNSWVR